MRFSTVTLLCLFTLTAQAQETSPLLGYSLVVSNGEIIAVQPEYTRTSAAFVVFRQSEEGWQLATRHVVEGVTGADNFGSAMAVSGNLLAIGADEADEGSGAVYLFERTDSGEWVQSDRLSIEDSEALLGADVALYEGILLAGAPGINTVLVVRDPGTGDQVIDRLTIDDLSEEDEFGAAVAYDGTHIWVGAPRSDSLQGAAYAFGLAEDGYSPMGKLSSPAHKKFGMDIQVGGGSVLITAPGLSVQDLFSRGNNFFFDTSNPASGPLFEVNKDPTADWALTIVVDSIPDIDLVFDGAIPFAVNDETLLIGSPGGDGKLLAYERSEDRTHWTLNAEVEGLSNEDGFGEVIALDGNQVAVLAPAEIYDMGVIVALEKGDNRWGRTGRISLVEEITLAKSGRVDCEEGAALHFACSSVDLLSFMTIADLGGEDDDALNDIWGWTDPETGVEYALVGRTNGTSFVDISNPSAPVLIGDLPLTDGAYPNSWRDIKVYKDHAYVVADNSGPHGMQVFDLTQLRDVTEPPVTFEEASIYRGVGSAHNVIINEATGFAFIVGFGGGGEENCGSGLHIVNIQDPANPEFAGCFIDTETGRGRPGATHDAQCVTYHGPDAEHAGKEICLSSNANALSIADVTDKENPIALASVSYPGVRYAHQGWLTEDHAYFYLNDELDELGGEIDHTRTLIWDVHDLDDPVLSAEFFADNRSSDHNLYIQGNLMYQSNYGSGLRIFDITDILNPVEVGFFDTITTLPDAPGFIGSWSNYPYFESGTIIVSSIDEGLFVVKMQDVDT